ncbi:MULTISPECIES: bacterioferritin-associated ferredoxin [unclassified Streptomyces]|uniref:(2Fe-2S)-binding protein n=1 Tax=unclassified Streptomyces TaxID=2593676 RepID=UPI00225AC13B|nr:MULTISPECIES: (2Fe-2S)-binding protein [unclassified Streptomyces]MCX5139723.1 (2Fe-2S)-binding protein [Streptomyces sp. NBC_00338]WRZ64378.1 (2Fe-2S)-binding protein [Streptomyces sp. NBC_01257]WSU58341.1 (2Fe-2S)-binding protein [Streptomyces sp. NBC_01104]
MYVCSCFGVTEQQVKKHAEAGACTPRQIASACKAGTDCGGCVRTIQAMLGRGACPRRDLLDQKRTPGTADRLTAGAVPDADQVVATGTGPVPASLSLPDAA